MGEPTQLEVTTPRAGGSHRCLPIRWTDWPQEWQVEVIERASMMWEASYEGEPFSLHQLREAAGEVRAMLDRWDAR
jgi:hypothetical protein